MSSRNPRLDLYDPKTTDSIASGIRARVQRLTTPPEEQPRLDQVSADSLAFIFKDVLGRAPPEYIVVEALDLYQDLNIDSLEALPSMNDDPVSMEIVRDTYPKADAGAYVYQKTVSLEALDAAFAKTFGDEQLDLDRRVIFVHGVPSSTKLPKSVASLATILWRRPEHVPLLTVFLRALSEPARHACSPAHGLVGWRAHRRTPRDISVCQSARGLMGRSAT